MYLNLNGIYLFKEASWNPLIVLIDFDSKTIAASAMGLLTTPYDENIATLRRDRLRLEEERLLELKKLEEIERLRPPREKW